MEKHPEPKMGTEEEVIASRLIAFILDLFIESALAFVPILVGVILADASTALSTLFYLVAVAVAIVYWLLLEGLYGYTPGKYVMGLVVVKTDGSNCTIGTSVIRNLLLIVDNFPFAFILGIVLILVTDRHQRVGDLVADTVVLEQR